MWTTQTSTRYVWEAEPGVPKDEYLRYVALVLLRRMGFPLSTSPCRAPGWVRSTSDENFNNSMAFSKISKRLCPDSDTSISSFPRFVVLESLEDKHLTKKNICCT